MIAFFNPKILVFFVAIFAQFINNQIGNFDRLVIAVMAGVIDTIWYVSVALVLAGTPLIDRIRINANLIDRIIGIILILIAASLIIKTLGPNLQ